AAIGRENCETDVPPRRSRSEHALVIETVREAEVTAALRVLQLPTEYPGPPALNEKLRCAQFKHLGIHGGIARRLTRLRRTDALQCPVGDDGRPSLQKLRFGYPGPQRFSAHGHFRAQYEDPAPSGARDRILEQRIRRIVAHDA